MEEIVNGTIRKVNNDRNCAVLCVKEEHTLQNYNKPPYSVNSRELLFHTAVFTVMFEHGCHLYQCITVPQYGYSPCKFRKSSFILKPHSGARPLPGFRPP